MTKGIIYYTNNRLDEPVFSIVQNEIAKANLPIVSISLSPIEFGKNFVLLGESGIVTMLRQIELALSKSTTDYVFFCEHDCLYPLSHFDFTPPKNNIFYYNANVYRWDYPNDRLVTYDRLISLSGLCVNREFALDHYGRRLKEIFDNGYEKDKSHEPYWARKWGYEPGTKKVKRGGFSDDDFETWKSEIPMIDIRHGKTFSPPKTKLSGFKHLPQNWKEITIDEVPGWDLKKMFKLV